MRRSAPSGQIVAAAVAILAGLAAGAGPEGGNPVRKNVLVELFTSHG